ncbi:type II secretion system protein GspM [Verminephrobacter eiseniae]|uniref:type II secretion system protein GspM n=1 Tax=Verminephrobacter eiseniae TaxID=364317 RepID=UPI0022379BD7|nr:type II secretion system protein GspM [Verminephrobacter eiseniae]MCW5235988.1 general secretion pathway protein GspM [Verminephrobacter eiseniae]
MKPGTRLLTPQSLLLLLVAAVALPLAAGGAYVLQKHQWAQERLDQLAPRYARLLGLQGSADQLRAANAQAHALLAQYVYAANLDASQVGNHAQQRIRDIFSAAGLQIVSSQVLPPKEQGNVDQIPLAVRTEGELMALQSALAVMSSQNPAIIIDGLNVQTLGAVNADKPQKLSIQFDLFVLRVRP